MNIHIPHLTIAASVYAAVRKTIGSMPAETGGVLGGNPDTGEITRFFFDADASSSPAEYRVEAARINPVLQEWNAENVHLMGFVHSHPAGCQEPSAQDIAFSQRLLGRHDNASLPYLLFPIVQSADAGCFSLRCFGIFRDAPNLTFELPYTISEAPQEHRLPVVDAAYARTFARVCDVYDLHRLHHSLVMAVGCGGGAAYLEDLARAGVGRFLLIDPDIVSESNLATQQTYRRDIGRAKVAAVRERILDINPHATVDYAQRPLDAFSDEALRSLLFDAGPTRDSIAARLLCGLTDDFFAQMRLNLLALTFGLPALAAQVYRAGAAAEIVLMHPDTTKQCMRCILSSRYAAYLERGFRNDATSQGAQYFATVRLNASKLFATMALLHHGTDHPFWGSMLSRIGQRACMQIRCDPDVAVTLNLPNFNQAFCGASGDQLFADETIWRPQHPEHPTNGYPYACPDCGGTGNLIECIGRFADTRAVVEKARHGVR